jgi:L-asparaginase II
MGAIQLFHIFKKTGEDDAMGKSADKKEVVAACMESPFYFAVPLKERLELMRQLQQPSFYCTLRQDFLFWIKTGRLIS